MAELAIRHAECGNCPGGIRVFHVHARAYMAPGPAHAGSCEPSIGACFQLGVEGRNPDAGFPRLRSNIETIQPEFCNGGLYCRGYVVVSPRVTSLIEKLSGVVGAAGNSVVCCRQGVGQCY